MTQRAIPNVIFFVIVPLGMATWILASHTLGESLYPRNAILLGFSMALLAMAAAASLLLMSGAAEQRGKRLGLVLILCGTVCILSALALQFYVVSVVAENNRRLTDILEERLRNSQSVKLDMNGKPPESVNAIAYFCLFAGVWLAAVGIRIGVIRQDPVE